MTQQDNWVNYKELKQKVGFKEILEHYGLLSSMNQKGDELIGICPFHKESQSSFHVSISKNAFHCFGCHAKGNILDFVQQKESITLREAAILIKQWFAMGQGDKAPPAAKEGPEQGNKEREQPPEGEANPPLTFILKKLDTKHPYLKDRGLSDKAIEHFGLGYCARGLMKGRVAIPIHDAKGDLVAYAGRWPGDPPEEEPKYKLPPGFKKHLVLFNFHRAINENKEKSLVVVEGFFDCFQVWQAGYRRVIALMGSFLSEEQEDLIISQAKFVSLLMDQDEAGRKAAQEILPRLARKIFVRVVELPAEGDQPDKLSQEYLACLFSTF